MVEQNNYKSSLYYFFPRGLFLGCLLIMLSGHISYSQSPFITTWKTDNDGISNSTSIRLPIIPGRSGYNFDVDWDNDGVYDDIGVTGEITHDYGVAGTYTVRIKGDLPHIYFADNDEIIGSDHDDALKIIEINQWGDIEWESMYFSFFGCENMELKATDAPDLSNVSSLNCIFRGCYKFNANVNHWDVSTITDFFGVFNNCYDFDQPLDNWDMSGAATISYMLFRCSKFNQPLNTWDVSNVTNFTETFVGCEAFNQPLDNWNTSSATTFIRMFNRATSFNQDISMWDVSKVTNLTGMFANTGSFNQNINNWNVSSCKDFSSMFDNATAFNQDISGWNLSKATTIERMFNNATTFNQDIDGWDVSAVTNMEGVFAGATSFNQDLNSWDVSNVTTMRQLFMGATVFDGNIADWDISNVNDVTYLFYKASSFNQDISGWQPISANNFLLLFSEATSFNQNIGTWDVSGVVKMQGTFRKAKSFNQDISNWDVGSVTDMNEMFKEATIFNNDIGNWDVSNVTTMSSLFSQAKAFNQDLGDWDVGNVTTFHSMFDGATNYNQNLGNWDVSSVQILHKMFQGTSMDQDLSSWDVSNVTDAKWMFNNVTMSTSNYDNILIEWSKQSLQSGVEFDGGDSKYCAGALARASLINDDGWIITDGGSEDDPPIAICQDITLTLDNTNTAILDASLLDGGSTDDCSGSLLGFSASKTYFDCSDLGTQPVTLTVTDVNGNTSTCDANVTIEEAPLFISNCPADITLAANLAGCEAAVTWTTPTTNCTATLSSTHNSGDNFPLGTTTVTYTASDGIGGTVSCSFDVTVTSDMSINLITTSNTSCFDEEDGQAFISVSGGVSPYAYDWDFDGTADFDDVKNQNTLPAGLNNVVVQDAIGCEQTLAVNMNYDPLMIYNCPSDITLLTNNTGCEAIATWSSPIVFCSSATLSSTHAIGDSFGIGTTTVTYTASNTIGEIVTCSFDITVYNDLAASIDGTTNTTCFDSKDGAASLTITGGVSPYTYDWDNDGTGDFDDAEDPTDLPEGVNNYTVRDATGCEVSGSVTIDYDPLAITGCPSDIIQITNIAGCQAIVNWSLPIVQELLLPQLTVLVMYLG